jgi:hypothetical protein
MSAEDVNLAALFTDLGLLSTYFCTTQVCDNIINGGSVPVILKLKYILHTVCGYAVVQLVEALHYKPEGRGFDSRLCQWNFPLI